MQTVLTFSRTRGRNPVAVKRILREESGAVSVDFIVLTAGVIALALTAGLVITNQSTEVSGRMLDRVGAQQTGLAPGSAEQTDGALPIAEGSDETGSEDGDHGSTPDGSVPDNPGSAGGTDAGNWPNDDCPAAGRGNAPGDCGAAAREANPGAAWGPNAAPGRRR